MLTNKIDFIVVVSVNNANPNGDPLAGNMPRRDSNGLGEISDVSIKRKIRNRMQDLGYEIFVQSRDRSYDNFNSLEVRYNNEFGSKLEKNNEQFEIDKSCEKWLDIRSFGQVITFGKRSIGIRGPVSISHAKSLEPVEITSMQITRSTNGQEPKGSKTRSSDTMGTKHFVENGTYIIYGAINSFFSEKTGFSNEDANVIKEALSTLFINDASSARPEGSMEVNDVFWFTHSNKTGNISSGKIRNLLQWDTSSSKKTTYEDYKISLDQELLDKYKELGLTVEHLKGL